MIETLAPAELRNERVSPFLLRDAAGGRIASVAAWQGARAQIEADWRAYLGACPFPDFESHVIEGEVVDHGDCTGRRVQIKTEPEYFEEGYLLTPKEPADVPRPAVVVFYYEVETPTGLTADEPGPNPRHFARHLVQQGYVTLAVRWFHEGYVGRPRGGEGLSARYRESVQRFRSLAPEWKGLGRVAWDASRTVDYLASLDSVDPERIGCMGHSLGGKMALYAAAFDARFKAVIASDLGIGLAFSNWEQPWYLGPEIREPGFPLDHHQLLALIAPRAFLLISGESADGDRSWAYLNSAQDVYRLYDAEGAIGMVNHRTGHTPTMDSLAAAYAWLKGRL